MIYEANDHILFSYEYFKSLDADNRQPSYSDRDHHWESGK